MEIGVFKLEAPDKGSFHFGNPIITRKQFGLDQPGRGITPLSIIEHRDRLYLFCTARPAEDLQPRIVVIESTVEDPFTWKNMTVVIGPEFSGQANNHGVSVLQDPDNPAQLLVYFSALTAPEDYRILLAAVPVDKIMNPDAYRLLRGYDNPLLARKGAKANYPFVRYLKDRKEYELWYSGHSLDNSKSRSSFVTASKRKDQFSPATHAVIQPSGNPARNDAAYATGPKVHNGFIYYSGRRDRSGNYRGIFCRPLPK